MDRFQEAWARATAAWDAGDSSEAAKGFQECTRLEMANAEAWRRMAAARSRMRNSNGALNAARNSYRFDPDSTSSHIVLANTLFEAGAYGEVLEFVASVDDGNALHVELLSPKAGALLCLGRYAEAIVCSKECVERSEYLDFESVLRISEAQALLGNIEDSLNTLKELAESTPPYRLIPGAPDPRYVAHLRAGEMRLKMARRPFSRPQYRLAIEEFQRAATHNDLDPIPHTAASMAYRVLGKGELALEEADRAIRLEPDNPFAHYQRALSLVHEKRFDEAETEFGLADRDELDENFSDEITLYRVLAAFRMGDYEFVLKASEFLIDKGHDDVLLRNARGAAFLGVCDYSNAQSELELALRLSPDDIVARANLGIVLHRSGDSAAARPLLDDAASRWRERPVDEGVGVICGRLMFIAETEGAEVAAEEESSIREVLAAEDPEVLAIFERAVEKTKHDLLEHALQSLPATQEQAFNAGREAAASKSLRPTVQVILFTDIVDSTDTQERLGDEGGRELGRVHDQILKDSAGRWRVGVQKNTGDGLMACFESAVDAVSCALEARDSLARYNAQHVDEPIPVRFGLNAGEPIPEEGDAFGISVTAASRICGKAKPGQVVVSDVVRQLLHGSEFGFHKIGRRKLKGIADSVTLFEIRHGRS